MKKLLIACVTVGVAVGAGVWLCKRWKGNKKKCSEDEVSAQNLGAKEQSNQNKEQIVESWNHKPLVFSTLIGIASGFLITFFFFTIFLLSQHARLFEDVCK